VKGNDFMKDLRFKHARQLAGFTQKHWPNALVAMKV